MATISNTPRPGYVWDATDNVWYPIGVGGHGHTDYITQATAVNPTIIDAKGDILTATAADTPARLAVGNNGETLVADSSTSTGLRYQGSMAAGRNAVINGGMDVWQRGTSIALSANTAVYSTDRFMAYSVAGNRTVSRQVTNDSTNLPFIQYATRLQRNNTNTETNQIRFVMSLETVNSIPLAGKSVVFSFYARAGANYSGGVLTNQVRTGTGTDQNLLTAGYTGGAYPSGLNNSATLTTTWQRFTYTGTTAGTTTEIGIEFNWTPTGTAGADDWVEITGVQLEAGSVATQFSRAGGTIQGEYAACRRYYRRTSANGTNQYSVVAQGSASNTTNGAMMVPFDVSMRIAPTVVDYSTLRLADGVGAWTITAVAIDTNLISADYGFINCTVASGLTQYRPLFIQSNASASAYLGFSAEL